MLPPVEESVLQNNPQFASLYHTLTTAVLNPDGSTKNKTVDKEREAVREEIKAHRLTHAKRQLLAHAIENATPPEPKAPRGTIGQPRPKVQPADLPDALLDLLCLLPSLLDTSTSSSSSTPRTQEEEAALLASPPLSELETLLPQLAPIVASSLRESAVALARVAHPATNPSFLHRTIPSLAATAARQAAEVDSARDTLARERLELNKVVVALLGKYSQAMGLLVRALEGKHGVVARSLELRATEAGVAARRAELEAGIAAAGVRGDVYSPEAVAALRNYSAHLRDATMRVEESVKVLERELGGYGVGVQGGEEREGRMREMARVKQGMEREVEEVRRDLDRLKKA